jgi:hypothetical protein
LEKVCRRLVPGGGARFLVTKVVLDSAVMGSVYVAAFFAFGSVVLEGNGLQGFMQKMKVRLKAPLVKSVVFAFVAVLMTASIMQQMQMLLTRLQ